MKEINININFKCYAIDELTETEQKLVKQAKTATYNAYAKYSRFYVGAALLLDNGTIVIGANQENAAFPSGLCAERSAIFAAQSKYPDQPINVLAIAARNDNGFISEPITPCGSCRQVILEIENRYKQPTKILLYGTEGVYSINSIKDLLPLSFIDENMK